MKIASVIAGIKVTGYEDRLRLFGLLQSSVITGTRKVSGSRSNDECVDNSWYSYHRQNFIRVDKIDMGYLSDKTKVGAKILYVPFC